MQTGLILALIAGFSFSVAVVIVRKAAAAAGESFSVTVIGNLIGLPVFALAVTLTDEWHRVLSIAWQPLVLLTAAGIIHFVFGRLLGYNAYRTIGANKATPFIMTNPFYTVLFSYLFLGESVTWFIVGGVLFMFLGAFLTTREKATVAEQKEKGAFSTETKGILLALAAALCWGFTPVLIKPGEAAIGSSVAAIFVSYCAAGTVTLAMLARRPLRLQVTQLPLVKCFIPMAVAALFTAAGQLLMYSALSKSPANLVIPLLSGQSIIIFLLSWMVNRRQEIFTWKVALGMAATLAGTFLLFK